MKPTPRALIQDGGALRFQTTPTMAKERRVHPPQAPPTEILLSGPVTPVGGGDQHETADSAQGIPTKANAWVGF